MSDTNHLSAELRERSGKGAARAVRRQGRVPAVIYGGNEPPVMISLPYKDVFLKIQAGGFLSHVATIEVGGEAIQVIPRDYQLDPVKDFPVHVDFLRVTAGATIAVEIPVRFRNEEKSPGLRRGGVLNVVRYAVEVEAPIDRIPEEIVVDLAGLDINDSVHISSVTLPEGVAPTVTDRDFTIATIAPPAGFNEDLETPADAPEVGVTEAERGGGSDE